MRRLFAPPSSGQERTVRVNSLTYQAAVLLTTNTVPLSIHLHFCLPTHPSIHPSIRRSVDPSIRRCVDASMRRSVDPSIRRSVDPSIDHLSLYLYMSPSLYLALVFCFSSPTADSQPPRPYLQLACRPRPCSITVYLQALAKGHRLPKDAL